VFLQPGNCMNRGAVPWTAADALVGLSRSSKASVLRTQERVRGDPRRPGGLPHGIPQITDIGKKYLSHHERVLLRGRRDDAVHAQVLDDLAVVVGNVPHGHHGYA